MSQLNGEHTKQDQIVANFIVLAILKGLLLFFKKNITTFIENVYEAFQ